MLKTRYKGLIAASFTPFAEDGGLALEKIPQVFEFTSRMKIAATGKKTKALNSV